jgi:hypothetical protein
MNQLQQTKYPDFIITFEVANSIVDILIEHCGVAANRKKTIVEDLMWTQPTEYRFQGALGFGGKLYNEDYRESRLKVSCYPEDKTPEIDLMIQTANNKLSVLYKENKHEN